MSCDSLRICVLYTSYVYEEQLQDLRIQYEITNLEKKEI